jgi:peptidylprolyl isomerase
MKKLLAIFLAIGVVLALTGCGEKKSEKAEAPSAPSTEEKTSEPAAPEAKSSEVAPEKTEDGFIVTKSGLKYKDIKVGTGPAVKAGDTVKVDYKGWLDDGTVFDTSKQPGREPFSFAVGTGTVIKGWDEGLQGMKKGGKRELIIPPDLGYGSEDMGTIPPNSTLHFSIELHKIGA